MLNSHMLPYNENVCTPYESFGLELCYFYSDFLQKVSRRPVHRPLTIQRCGEGFSYVSTVNWLIAVQIFSSSCKGLRFLNEKRRMLETRKQ